MLCCSHPPPNPRHHPCRKSAGIGPVQINNGSSAAQWLFLWPWVRGCLGGGEASLWLQLWECRPHFAIYVTPPISPPRGNFFQISSKNLYRPLILPSLPFSFPPPLLLRLRAWLIPRFLAFHSSCGPLKDGGGRPLSLFPPHLLPIAISFSPSPSLFCFVFLFCISFSIFVRLYLIPPSRAFFSLLHLKPASPPAPYTACLL